MFWPCFVKHRALESPFIKAEFFTALVPKRCYGCGERRPRGEWWRKAQVAEAEPPQQWGFFQTDQQPQGSQPSYRDSTQEMS